MAALALSRSEYLVTQRPRLLVRNINVKNIGDADVTAHGKIRYVSPGEIASGQLYIENYGGSKARLVEFHIAFWVSGDPLPMARPYEGRDGNEAVPSGWVEPGESVPLLFSQPVETIDRIPGTFVGVDEFPLYAMGWVEFVDAEDRRRRVAFCRKYVPTLSRFTPQPTHFPDYESDEMFAKSAT